MKNDLQNLRECHYCGKPFLRLPDHPAHEADFCSDICQSTAQREQVTAAEDAAIVAEPDAPAPASAPDDGAACYRAR